MSPVRVYTRVMLMVIDSASNISSHCRLASPVEPAWLALPSPVFYLNEPQASGMIVA